MYSQPHRPIDPRQHFKVAYWPLAAAPLAAIAAAFGNKAEAPFVAARDSF
jgi:hypothetical protein